MLYPRTSRLVLALLTGLMLAGSSLAVARPAAASQGWCWDDPIVRIGTHVVTIENGVYGDPAQVDKAVSKAINTVYLPQGVPVELLSYTKTFFKDKQVNWVRTAQTWTPGQEIPVRVVTTYKAKQDLPAQTIVSIPGGTLASGQGTTFSQTEVQFTLPASTTN